MIKKLANFWLIALILVGCTSNEALFRASADADLPGIKKAIKCSDVNAWDPKTQKSPLLLVLKAGSGLPDCVPAVEAAKFLIDFGADVNAKEGGGDNDSSLHFVALRDGLMEIGKILIDKGADVNVTNVFGLTPLHKASKACQLEMVDLLIKTKGININPKDIDEKTPLKLVQWKIDNFRPTGDFDKLNPNCNLVKELLIANGAK